MRQFLSPAVGVELLPTMAALDWHRGALSPLVNEQPHSMSSAASFSLQELAVICHRGEETTIHIDCLQQNITTRNSSILP